MNCDKYSQYGSLFKHQVTDERLLANNNRLEKIGNCKIFYSFITPVNIMYSKY